MEDGSHNRRSTEAFFGRRRGKAMSPLQAAALEAGLLRFGLDLSRPAPPDARQLFAAPVGEVRLEIGFGGGEHLLNEARSHPATGFIGVEPFVNSLAKMMAALTQTPLDNLRIYDDDATRVLDWLPDASLSGIDLFYPDPWPKKRHWKRRFVNAGNLDRFARIIRKGGVFRFASDIADYVNWTLLECSAHRQFEWRAVDADDWRRPYDGWPGTRYEAKALRENRHPAYLAFERK